MGEVGRGYRITCKKKDPKETTATDEKATPLDKSPVYQALAQRYGWTFGVIANMTSRQQLVALSSEGSDETITFQSMREYREWVGKREKLK